MMVMALAPNLTLACTSKTLVSSRRPSNSSILQLPSLNSSLSNNCESRYPFRCSLQNSSSLSTSLPHTTISNCNDTLSAIRTSGVVACLRADSAESALEAARAALNGGITVLEIVMSTPGVFEVLQQLVLDYPTKTIGVGTVLNPADAKNAINCGAKFLLSPAMVKGILDYVSGSQALYIPGAMTPTEILTAFSCGAQMIKVYPVSALGGIRYISALKKPFPHIPMIASQGITAEMSYIFSEREPVVYRWLSTRKVLQHWDLQAIAHTGYLVEEYIAHGATSVVLSDAIFSKKAMGERNFKAIYEISRSLALRAIAAVERKRICHPQ